MEQLDRTEQRIVGVLIEKQLAVPDSYPLTENALLAGCNQVSNRDPVMALQAFEVAGALMALHEKEVVVRIEGGGRVAKYRHKLDERLALGDRDLPVLAELLLRGPQAPGALKQRVARMGWHATPEQIEDVLRNLAAQKPPLVTLLPHRPRERDRRWQHLLGDVAEASAAADVTSESAPQLRPRPTEVVVPASSSVASAGTGGTEIADLLARLSALENRVSELERDGSSSATDSGATDP